MKFYLVTISAFLALNGYAQQKSISDTIFSIKEISVVSPSLKTNDLGKLNVPLQYLPISVNTVSANTLTMRGISNLEDAVKFLPNTRMRTTYGGFQQFEVRGFDYTPIMIDGVRDERTSISNSSPATDLSAVESIELLKGPASVLYGHSTVGGVVNIKRKDPVEKNLVNVLLSYGSYENKRAMMDIGGKFMGPFNYRAVVDWSDSEGYRYTNDKRFTGYFALGAKLDEKQSIDIRGGFNRDSYGTEIGLPKTMANEIYNSDGTKYLSKGDMLPGLNRRWRYNNESDFLKNNGSNILVTYRNNISQSFKLENKLAYNYDNIDYLCTEDLGYKESSDPIYNHYYMKGDERQYIQLDSLQLNSPLRFAYTLHVINEQIEASGKFTFGNGMKYNYLGGYNFVAFFRDRYRGYQLANKYDAEGNITQTADLYGPGRNNIMIPTYNPVSNGTVDSKFSDAIVNRTYTHSFYLQNLVELSSQFKVMVSGRYDYFNYQNATAGIDNGKRKYINRKSFMKTHNSALTYRVGAVYLPTSNLSVYGSFANFFMPYRDLVDSRTIYINSDGNRFQPKDGEEIFKPQKGYQAEIGTRYYFNSLLQATGSVFYIRKNNEKKTLKTGVIEDGITKSIIGTVGSSESKGFELELILTPTPNSALSLGYGYTDAKIRDIKKNEYLNTEANKGMRLAGVPKNTFFAAGNYTITRGLFKQLGFNATLTYTDNVYRDLNKSVIYPSYWITDMGASYKLNNGILFRANVNNLFDADYYNQSLGTQMVPSTPRNYLLTIAYNL